ncbi:hypothetical protein [Agrobacterium cavarae]|uniref:hypothetical protein n=1 Tax=Agrobacterium cavarae TaxID=2528239 RepID=UPI00289E25D8|nr:hypothetical protein [Agrobacterium cavarae]
MTKPPKEKFALCVCIADGLFVWINTDPAPHGRDQLPIPKGCHKLIVHDSHVDLSRIVKHPDWEMEEAKEFPCISKQMRDDIVTKINAGVDVLSPRHASLITTNLLTLY